MKVPEKIYLEAIYPDNGVLPNGLNYTPSPTDIEYVQTDAFINKACKWFRDIDYDDSIPPFETTEEFIEGFKKAMKL